MIMNLGIPQINHQTQTFMIRILVSLLGEEENELVLPPILCTRTAGLIETSGNIVDNFNDVLGVNDNEVGVNYNYNGQSINFTSNGRLEGYFVSDTVFNLSNKVLSDVEIRVLSKGLSFVPTPSSINETEL